MRVSIILSKDFGVLVSVLSLLDSLWGFWDGEWVFALLFAHQRKKFIFSLVLDCEKLKVLNTGNIRLFITLLECYNMALRISYLWLLGVMSNVSIGRQEEGSGIASLEVKFSDRSKTNRCESCNTHHTSVNQERKLGDRRWLDTIVVLTVNYNDKRLARNLFTRSPQNLKETESFWFPGEVWSQGWNLKELTEEHHQEWSLRLNSTQHGKSHQVRILGGLTEQSSFMIW